MLHENFIITKSKGIIFIYLTNKNKLQGPFRPVHFQPIHWNHLKGKVLNRSGGGGLKSKTQFPQFPKQTKNVE